MMDQKFWPDDLMRDALMEIIAGAAELRQMMGELEQRIIHLRERVEKLEAKNARWHGGAPETGPVLGGPDRNHRPER
jgi:hypothetical protein